MRELMLDANVLVRFLVQDVPVPRVSLRLNTVSRMW